MNLFGITRGFAFGNDARAMSENEMLEWQVSQQKAMLQTHNLPNLYLQGLAQYNPYPEKPLEERFANFKVRLAAAVERHKIGLAFPSEITPNQAGS
jgi:hypothetical protein